MIKLIDNYVIQAEERCYTLAIDTGKDDKNGKRVYKFVGYYNTIRNAITACYKDICRKKVAENTYTIKEAIQAFKEVEEALEKVMPKEFK